MSEGGVRAATAMKKTDEGGELITRSSDGQFYDPMALTWSTRYDHQLTKLWNVLPESVAKIVATMAVFALGVSINGDWIIIWTHLARQFGYCQNPNLTAPVALRWSDITLEHVKLKNLWSFWWPSCVVSYGMYFLIGGFIHWYYYVRQRDKPEEWKCQPHKWLTPELERDELFWGTSTLFVNATVSSVLSCYISNGGYSTVYYKFDEYGWLWFVLQFPVIFICQDYVTYWLHRMYHTPFFYKRFHKLHHRYKQPTAFSVTAIHPVESLHIQLGLMCPLFFIPLHWLPFYATSLYAYYHGIIDHSGVNFKSFWWQPWQPDSIFHDNHHQYFHVNFAFNIYYWDILHGTYRRKDRVYNEETFYGTGKSVDAATTEELKADLEERNLENPLAYRQDMPYKLSEQDLKILTKKKH